jgi:hypothetical protein
MLAAGLLLAFGCAGEGTMPGPPPSVVPRPAPSVVPRPRTSEVNPPSHETGEELDAILAAKLRANRAAAPSGEPARWAGPFPRTTPAVRPSAPVRVDQVLDPAAPVVDSPGRWDAECLIERPCTRDWAKPPRCEGPFGAAPWASLAPRAAAQRGQLVSVTGNFVVGPRAMRLAGCSPGAPWAPVVDPPNAPKLCCNGSWAPLGLVSDGFAVQLEHMECRGDESRLCCTAPATGQPIIAIGTLDWDDNLTPPRLAAPRSKAVLARVAGERRRPRDHLDSPSDRPTSLSGFMSPNAASSSPDARSARPRRRHQSFSNPRHPGAREHGFGEDRRRAAPPAGGVSTCELGHLGWRRRELKTAQASRHLACRRTQSTSFAPPALLRRSSKVYRGSAPPRRADSKMK